MIDSLLVSSMRCQPIPVYERSRALISTLSRLQFFVAMEINGSRHYVFISCELRIAEYRLERLGILDHDTQVIGKVSRKTFHIPTTKSTKPRYEFFLGCRSLVAMPLESIDSVVKRNASRQKKLISTLGAGDHTGRGPTIEKVNHFPNKD